MSRRRYKEFQPWGLEDARLGALRVMEQQALQPDRRMGVRCQLCQQPPGVRLDADTKILAMSVPYAEIGTAHGSDGYYTVEQVIIHRDKHMLPLLGLPVPRETKTALMAPLPLGGAIQQKLGWYRTQFLALKQQFMIPQEDGSVRPDLDHAATIITLLKEARQCDILAMKFREGDGARPVNGIDGAKWERIKVRLSTALEGHPEAKLAVLEALEDTE